MSEGRPRAKRGRGFLGFLVGLVIGATGAILLPSYLPSVPWRGQQVEGTVLEKRREADRLLLRVSTAQGLMLATFSERQEDIDLLVEREDVVVLEVEAFAPFAENPELVSVRRQQSTTTAPASSRKRTLERLEAELEDWEREIERLRQRAAASGEGARSRSQEIIGQLQARKRAARERLSALAGASGEAWDELRGGVERAWSDLEAALETAEEEIESPPSEP